MGWSSRNNQPRPTPRGHEPGAIGVRLAADLMKDFGISKEVAYGVVGSLAHESGNFNILQEMNPTVEGSRGGYGYAQWTGPRREAFESYAKEQGYEPDSYAANYGHLKHELQNTSEGRVLKALEGVTDPYEAQKVFTDTFLRPGIKGYNSRNRYVEGLSGIPDPGNVDLSAAYGYDPEYDRSPRAEAGDSDVAEMSDKDRRLHRAAYIQQFTDAMSPDRGPSYLDTIRPNPVQPIKPMAIPE